MNDDHAVVGCPAFLGWLARCGRRGPGLTTGPVPGNKNYMDDVAFFLSHTDLRGDLSGTQKVRTFVVGYGSSHPMLKSIAVAGQGSFFQANQPGALRDALLQSLAEIRATAP